MISASVLALAAPVTVLVLVSSAARAVHLILFERYFKLTFEHAPVWSLFYFGAWTTLVVLLFPAQMHALFAPVSFFGFFVLAFFLFAVFPLVYRTLRKRVGNPAWLLELYPGQGMLTLEERYIVAKIGDVIFQQCIAGAVILILAAGGVPYPQLVGVFVALFIFAHLYIFRTAGFFWGVHYTAYAAFGGFAFPFFIMFVPGGIGYAIVLHMLFYVLSAAFFAKMPNPTRAVCHDCVGTAPALAH